MPTHDYIDSNIIIEILLEGELKEFCERYIYRLNHYGDPSGLISSLVLGEITLAIFNKIESSIKRNLAFDVLFNKIKSFDIIGLNEETFKIASELTELDYNLKNEPADALHIAVAISKKANRFVTLEDKKFNQNLRNYVKQKGTKIVTLVYKNP